MSWLTFATKVGIKSKGFGQLGQEDPHDIIRDAMDPTVPADEVMARARIRSSTGKLVEKCAELIAQRQTGLLDVAAQIGNSIL